MLIHRYSDSLSREPHRDAIVQATDYATAVATPRDYLFRTGSTKDIHLVFGVVASGAAKIELYEGATISGVGTPVPTFRMNRQTVKSTEALIFHTPTIGADGSRIQQLYNAGTGAGGNQSGGQVAAHDDAEWLLKRSTDYIIRIIPSASSTISITMEWYEVDI